MRRAPLHLLALALAAAASATEEYRVCKASEVGTVVRRLKQDSNGKDDGKYYNAFANGWYYDEYYDPYLPSIDAEDGLDHISANLTLAKAGGGSPFNMAQEPGPYAIDWNRYPTPSPIGTAWAYGQTLATCPEQIPLGSYQAMMHSCLSEPHSDENYYDGFYSNDDATEFAETDQEVAMKILVPGICYDYELMIGAPMVVYSTEDRLFFDLRIRATCLWVEQDDDAWYTYMPSLFF